MTKLWPGGDNLTDVFDAHRDPFPGENIEDKHGLVSFGTGMLAGTRLFPSLEMSGLDLLAFVDPEESKRVGDAANQRATIRRRRERLSANHSSWFIHDTNPVTEAEEQETLALFGLTVESAKKLVAAKKAETSTQTHTREDGQGGGI